MENLENIFAVYKPKGPTSNQILNKIRKIYGTKKVGHAGTLDPLASGVLVVGVGRPATKKLGEAVQKEKEYLAKVKLGQVSSTYDEEGEKSEMIEKNISKQDIKKILPKFIGNIKQTPPIYSAIKIKGKEAYKYARAGQTVKMQEREALIKDIELLDYTWPYFNIRVVTGPGVYIRSLAHDIGQALGVGAYLAELERTRVGEFLIDKALKLEEIKKHLNF